MAKFLECCFQWPIVDKHSRTCCWCYALNMGLRKMQSLRAAPKNKRILNEIPKTFSLIESMNYVWGMFCSGEITGQKPATTGSRVALIFL